MEEESRRRQMAINIVRKVKYDYEQDYLRRKLAQALVKDSGLNPWAYIQDLIEQRQRWFEHGFI